MLLPLIEMAPMLGLNAALRLTMPPSIVIGPAGFCTLSTVTVAVLPAPPKVKALKVAGMLYAPVRKVWLKLPPVAG